MAFSDLVTLDMMLFLLQLLFGTQNLYWLSISFDHSIVRLIYRFICVAVGKIQRYRKEILSELGHHGGSPGKTFLAFKLGFNTEIFCSILIIVEFYIYTIITTCNILFYIFFIN